MYKLRSKVVFTNERIITPSGLGIIGGMLGKRDFVKRCNRIRIDKKRNEPQIKNTFLVYSLLSSPKAREITDVPPTPNMVLNAIKARKTGIASDTARYLEVIVCLPDKKVSARL